MRRSRQRRSRRARALTATRRVVGKSPRAKELLPRSRARARRHLKAVIAMTKAKDQPEKARRAGRRGNTLAQMRRRGQREKRIRTRIGRPRERRRIMEVMTASGRQRKTVSSHQPRRRPRRRRRLEPRAAKAPAPAAAAAAPPAPPADRSPSALRAAGPQRAYYPPALGRCPGLAEQWPRLLDLPARLVVRATSCTRSCGFACTSLTLLPRLPGATTARLPGSMEFSWALRGAERVCVFSWTAGTRDARLRRRALMARLPVPIVSLPLRAPSLLTR
mmetsp:Transcript_84009/g.246414  ORF Transcript_84009/g.246414 Transcript_84009/m.246414 type:complete len:276 (-) Transcript_84009:105-932(-)